MTAAAFALIILVLAAGGTVLLLIRSASGRRRSVEDVPPAMRPGYSDEELEQKVRARWLAWGGVLVMFFAIFLPAYWLLESSRLQEENIGFFSVSLQEGEELYTDRCATCHGADAKGGAAESIYDGQDAWIAPNLTTIAGRYEDSRIVDDVRQYISTTLHRGRAGTPMPAWGAEYGGPLTDQQIESITDWILSQQVPVDAEASAAVNSTGEELYVQNCAKCHGQQGEGLVGPSLVGVFERHSEETVLAILRNGINLTRITMPPWQNGYMYEDLETGEPFKYNDAALMRMIDYLREFQPANLPADAEQYQTPGKGPLPEAPAEGASEPAAGASETAVTELEDAS
ncbi:MAG: cytochrome c [Egibacteraceae bacterium]